MNTKEVENLNAPVEGRKIAKVNMPLDQVRLCGSRH